MDESKQERLKAKGWEVGTVTEFLDLTPEETALIEIKLALSKNVKARGRKTHQCHFPDSTVAD